MASPMQPHRPTTRNTLSLQFLHLFALASSMEVAVTYQQPFWREPTGRQSWTDQN